MRVDGVGYMTGAIANLPNVTGRYPAQAPRNEPAAPSAAGQGDLALKLILASLTGKGTRVDRTA